MKATAASLTLVTLSGCASTSDGRLAQGQGTALGAIAGGLIGYALGGEQGAIRGAALGGAAGFAYGSVIAKKKAQYASIEAFMQAEIAAAQSHNQAIASYNASLEQRIAGLERRARVAKANRDKAAITSIRTEVAQLQKEAQGTQKAFAKETDYYEAVVKDPQASQTNQAQSLNSLASQMRANENDISTTSRRLADLNRQLTL